MRFKGFLFLSYTLLITITQAYFLDKDEVAKAEDGITEAYSLPRLNRRGKIWKNQTASPWSLSLTSGDVESESTSSIVTTFAQSLESTTTESTSFSTSSSAIKQSATSWVVPTQPNSLLSELNEPLSTSIYHEQVKASSSATISKEEILQTTASTSLPSENTSEIIVLSHVETSTINMEPSSVRVNANTSWALPTQKAPPAWTFPSDKPSGTLSNGSTTPSTAILAPSFTVQPMPLDPSSSVDDQRSSATRTPRPPTSRETSRSRTLEVPATDAPSPTSPSRSRPKPPETTPLPTAPAPVPSDAPSDTSIVSSLLIIGPHPVPITIRTTRSSLRPGTQDRPSPTNIAVSPTLSNTDSTFITSTIAGRPSSSGVSPPGVSGTGIANPPNPINLPSTSVPAPRPIPSSQEPSGPAFTNFDPSSLLTPSVPPQLPTSGNPPAPIPISSTFVPSPPQISTSLRPSGPAFTNFDPSGLLTPSVPTQPPTSGISTIPTTSIVVPVISTPNAPTTISVSPLLPTPVPGATSDISGSTNASLIGTSASGNPLTTGALPIPTGIASSGTGSLQTSSASAPAAPTSGASISSGNGAGSTSPSGNPTPSDSAVSPPGASTQPGTSPSGNPSPSNGVVTPSDTSNVPDATTQSGQSTQSSESAQTSIVGSQSTNGVTLVPSASIPTGSPTSTTEPLGAISTTAATGAGEEKPPPLTKGQTAGIAVGGTTCILIALVAALFLARRYQQKKAAKRDSTPSVYPEVAYLYDPPVGGNRDAEAGGAVPAMSGGAGGYSGAYANNSSSETVDYNAMPQNSPRLPPPNFRYSNNPFRDPDYRTQDAAAPQNPYRYPGAPSSPPSPSLYTGTVATAQEEHYQPTSPSVYAATVATREDHPRMPSLTAYTAAVANAKEEEALRALAIKPFAKNTGSAEYPPMSPYGSILSDPFGDPFEHDNVDLILDVDVQTETADSIMVMAPAAKAHPGSGYRTPTPGQSDYSAPPTPVTSHFPGRHSRSRSIIPAGYTPDGRFTPEFRLSTIYTGKDDFLSPRSSTGSYSPGFRKSSDSRSSGHSSHTTVSRRYDGSPKRAVYAPPTTTGWGDYEADDSMMYPAPLRVSTMSKNPMRRQPTLAGPGQVLLNGRGLPLTIKGQQNGLNRESGNLEVPRTYAISGRLSTDFSDNPPMRSKKSGEDMWADMRLEGRAF